MKKKVKKGSRIRVISYNHIGSQEHVIVGTVIEKNRMITCRNCETQVEQNLELIMYYLIRNKEKKIGRDLQASPE